MRWFTSIAAAAVLFASVGAAQAASLITNGSFETGTVSNPFSTLSAGSGDLSDWSIDSGSIDYIGNYWQPQDGSRSLDMSGLGAGAISQSFATAAGQQYEVSFYIAANPDGPPPVKYLESYVTGGSGTIVSVAVPFPQVASTKTNMNWVPVVYSFFADSATTTLHFLSLVSTPYGPALDNVSVSAVPLPAALPLLASGLLGLGLISRRRRRSAA